MNSGHLNMLHFIIRAFFFQPNCCAIEIIEYLATNDHLPEKSKQEASKLRNFKNFKNKLVICKALDLQTERPRLSKS